MKGRIVLRVLGAGCASLIVLLALLAYRVARGPLGLNWLTPYVARALSSEDGGLVVRIGSTELVWERHAHRLRLRVRDVEVGGPAGIVGRIPSLAIGVSLRTLLGRRSAPADVVMRGASLRLVLGADGRIDLGLGGGGTSTVRETPRAALDRLFGGPTTSGWLGSVVLEHGSLELVDPERGYAWHARDVNLALRPAKGGAVQAGLTGRLASGTTSVPVRVKAVSRPDGRLELAVAFDGLDPSTVVASLPLPPAVLRYCAGIRVPLDGRMVLSLNDALRPERARLKLLGGQGTVTLEPELAGPVPVERLRAGVVLDRSADAIQLQFLTLDLGTPTIRVQGELSGLQGTARAALGLSVDDVPVGDLGRYWPPQAAPEARDWVLTNIRKGRVDEARTQLRGTADPTSGTMRFEPPTVALRFAGLEVRYVPGMATGTGLAGTGTVTERGLNFHVARGNVGGLEVVRATVDIPIGKGSPPKIAVDVSVRGGLAPALTLLDQVPPAGKSRSGIAPADAAGDVALRLALVVPTRGKVDRRAVQPTASATLRDVSIARVIRGWTLTDGSFAVDLARAGGLTVRGTGRAQGVPVTLVAEGDLDAGLRTLDVRGDVGAEGCEALGFRGLPHYDGQAAVVARYAAGNAGAGKLKLEIDLARIAIDSSIVPLQKRAGEPGAAQVDVDLAGGAVAGVRSFDLGVRGSRATGSATLADGGTRVQRLDARVALAALKPADPPGFFTLKLTGEPERTRFSLTAHDAGAVFDALGTDFHLKRGELLFTGTVDPATSGWPLDGELDIRRFTLTHAPALTKVASLVSLSGIVRALSTHKGLEFDRLVAGVAHRGDVVTIKDGRLSGRSLGLLARGTVDNERETVAMTGTLVPAYYGVNAAAARVPVLGKVVTGTHREGVQVFDFDVQGPRADPKISVRPSSAAPGIVRDVLRRMQGEATP